MQETGRHHSAFTCAALSLPAKIEDRVPIDDAFEMIEDMVLSAVIEKVCRARRQTYRLWEISQMLGRDGSAFWNGSGRRRTAFTTEKIAVFAPMPSASVNTAMAVKPKFLPSVRSHSEDLRRRSSNRGPAPDFAAIFLNQSYIPKLAVRDGGRLPF